MDLRIIKTKKSIKEAFMQLRAKNDLERIKITELCELALINKTTFYKHYQDIFALSEELEGELINTIMNDFVDVDLLIRKPEDFLKGLYND
jgi:AcrR family transcriptional regulator